MKNYEINNLLLIFKDTNNKMISLNKYFGYQLPIYDLKNLSIIML